MRGNASEGKKIIQREVTIADGVEAVRGDARKAEFARDGLPVDPKGISRERARAYWAGVGAQSGVLQPGDITQERFRMGEQKMRKQNWLRLLHVRHARHGYIDFRFGLAQKRIQECGQAKLDFRRGIDYEKAKISGNEFVSAAAGVELPAERAEFFD